MIPDTVEDKQSQASSEHTHSEPSEEKSEEQEFTIDPEDRLRVMKECIGLPKDQILARLRDLYHYDEDYYRGDKDY